MKTRHFHIKPCHGDNCDAPPEILCLMDGSGSEAKMLDVVKIVLFFLILSKLTPELEINVLFLTFDNEFSGIM